MPICLGALRSFAFSARNTMLRTIRVVHAALREIFDEAAYDRYLQRTGDARSSASFAAFMAAGKQARERKPRCC